MKRFTKVLAVGSAALALAVPASAQLGAPHPGNGIGALGGGTGTSYDHHWAPMHSPVATQAWSGKNLFESIVIGDNFGGFGDSVRVCYGIDVTQGGRNWSGPGSTVPGPNGKAADLHPGGGQTENTWFRVHQAFASVALTTAQAGVDMGFVSIQAGTTTDIGQDNCFSPFFKVGTQAGVTQAGVETGGHKVGALALPGLFSGTGVASEPIYWEFSFNWAGSPALLQNKIGDDSGDPGVAYPDPLPARGVGNPLLSNVIFEVQAPVNGPTLGFLANQYYLSSTIEWGGLARQLPVSAVIGRRGLGGVTNGNGNWGFTFFGPGATGVNARDIIGATRFFGNAPSGLFIGTNKRIPTPLVGPNSAFRAGRNEFFNSLAFRTPRSWAYHNFKTSFGTGANFHTVGANHIFSGKLPNTPNTEEGRDGGNGQMLVTGNGGPDWRISGAPVSNVDIIAIDHEAGADINFNVYKKVGTFAFPSPPTYNGSVLTPVITSVQSPGGVYAHAAAGFDTSLGAGGFYGGTIPCYFPKFNRMVMLWSTSPSAPMIQVPGSWDNMGAFMGIEGTKNVSAFTTREGYQTSSVKFDAITILNSMDGLLLFGSRFRESDDFFQDGALDYGGNPGVPLFASIFEGGAVPMTSGQSDLKPANGQITISIPDMTLEGVPLYLSLSGSHVDLCNGSAFETTEQYNALTIVLQ